jgi:uncharacterized protein (TIGR00297 family)
MPATSELLRQTVHIAMGGLALLLRWLTWPQAVALAAIAVIANLTVLRRIAGPIFRDADATGINNAGIVLYPLAVLALLLIFPSRPDIVAAAWAILAAGDGFATIAGTHLRSPRLPWNRDKSVAGLIAFVVAASAAGIAVAWFVQREDATAARWWIVVAPALAAVAAAFVETAPIRLNDNISVPAVAAAVLWATSHVDAAVFAASWPALTSRAVPAVAINLLVAVAGWRAGTVTVAGAITGAIIGAVIYVGAGPAGWTMLLVAFVVASAATRAGYARKARLGIAEARGGRRGPANAIANTGIAAAAASLAPGLAAPEMALLALTAALATGASDTVASEVGKAWGRTTVLVTSGRRAAPGTSGAVSLEGTIAGIASAAALATIAWTLGLIPAIAIVIVTIAATVASLVEGALGATLEASGILDNDALNFVNTAVGAALALAAVWLFG